jgi:hypothetical protein
MLMPFEERQVCTSEATSKMYDNEEKIQWTMKTMTGLVAYNDMLEVSTLYILGTGQASHHLKPKVSLMTAMRGLYGHITDVES